MAVFTQPCCPITEMTSLRRSSTSSGRLHRLKIAWLTRSDVVWIEASETFICRSAGSYTAPLAVCSAHSIISPGASSSSSSLSFSALFSLACWVPCVRLARLSFSTGAMIALASSASARSFLHRGRNLAARGRRGWGHTFSDSAASKNVTVWFTVMRSQSGLRQSGNPWKTRDDCWEIVRRMLWCRGRECHSVILPYQRLCIDMALEIGLPVSSVHCFCKPSAASWDMGSTNLPSPF